MADPPPLTSMASTLAGPSTGPDLRLLYWAHRAPLYPSTHPGSSFLAVRFGRPVRVECVRIYPEGVGCLSSSARGLGVARVGRAGHLSSGLATSAGTGAPPVTATGTGSHLDPDHDLDASEEHDVDMAHDRDDDEGIGLTWPPRWAGTLFFNLSNAEPVNAMSSARIEYAGGERAVQWDVGMPDGVSTRLVILATPAETLSISIHGQDVGLTANVSLATATMPSAPDVEGSSATKELPNSRSKTETDWAFFSEWAGGVTGLLELLRVRLPSAPDSESPLPTHLDTSPPVQVQRALDCLDLMCRTDPSAQSEIFRLLLHPSPPSTSSTTQDTRPTAMSTVLNYPSALRDRLLTDPHRALHRSVCPHLPAGHPLSALVAEPHRAWDALHLGLAPLLILRQEKEQGRLRWFEGTRAGGSPLRLLLNRLDFLLGLDRRSAGQGSSVPVPDAQALEQALIAWALLDPPPAPAPTSGLPAKTLAALYASRLPRILIRLALLRAPPSPTANEQDPPLSLAAHLPPSRHTARLVVPQLAELGLQVVWDQLALSVARELARPYIEYIDRSRPSPAEALLFPDLVPRHTLSSSQNGPPVPVAMDSPDPAERRRARFSSHLLSLTLSHSSPSAAPTPSSLVHSLPPSALIHTLAPSLFLSLSTAASPPLGIPPAPVPGRGPHAAGGSAAAWAGKVYSEHDFRNRDTGREGSRSPLSFGGAGGRGSGGAAGGVGQGQGLGGGLGSGGGGGIGMRGAEARPASRHVDEYVR